MFIINVTLSKNISGLIISGPWKLTPKNKQNPSNDSDE